VDGGERRRSDHQRAQRKTSRALEGHVVFELDGEKINAPAGTFVFVQPGELSERYRELAKGDSDFDAIRVESAFEMLVAD
jgi:quercetin dioxygenase-like cupin family protein